jgi:hypothetical protein
MGNSCKRCNNKRCGGKPPPSLSMSMFNTQMICPECEVIERAHPKFEEARNVEVDQLHQKNFNFPGIGLPHDLNYEG